MKNFFGSVKRFFGMVWFNKEAILVSAIPLAILLLTFFVWGFIAELAWILIFVLFVYFTIVGWEKV